MDIPRKIVRRKVTTTSMKSFDLPSLHKKAIAFNKKHNGTGPEHISFDLGYSRPFTVYIERPETDEEYKKREKVVLKTQQAAVEKKIKEKARLVARIEKLDQEISS